MMAVRQPELAPKPQCESAAKAGRLQQETGESAWQKVLKKHV